MTEDIPPGEGRHRYLHIRSFRVFRGSNRPGSGPRQQFTHRGTRVGCASASFVLRRRRSLLTRPTGASAPGPGPRWIPPRAVGGCGPCGTASRTWPPSIAGKDVGPRCERRLRRIDAGMVRDDDNTSPSAVFHQSDARPRRHRRADASNTCQKDQAENHHRQSFSIHPESTYVSWTAPVPIKSP